MTENLARKFYDRISGVYDLIADTSEREAREKGLDLLAVQPGERVLEIGYGTGHTLISLAEKVGPEGRVCGIDISEGMHRVAGQRVAEAGFADRVTLAVGEVPPLPYENDQFDAVTMSFTLELFPLNVIPVLLGEVGRVLRDGGRLGVVCMATPKNGDDESLLERTYKWMHHHFPHIVDCQPIDVESFLDGAGFRLESDHRMDIWSLDVAAVVGRYEAASFPTHEKPPEQLRRELMERLVGELSNSDPGQRIRARREICRIGREATPLLIEALRSKDPHVRWEATKCLTHLRDPAAAPILVQELIDPASEVRWGASHALIALGDDAIIPVLSGLVKAPKGDTYELYHAAAHVLRELAARGHASLLAPVINAFGQLHPQIGVGVEAEKALQKLRSGKTGLS